MKRNFGDNLLVMLNPVTGAKNMYRDIVKLTQKGTMVSFVGTNIEHGMRRKITTTYPVFVVESMGTK